MLLKEKIAEQLPAWRERVTTLVKEHGDKVVDQITIKQIYGGMRSAKVLVTDISYVDPNEGIRYRGYTIPEMLKLLPKAEGSDFPLAGGLYYLLLVGEVPSDEQAQEIEMAWKSYGAIPPYVYETIRAMPPASHPMTMFSAAILSMQSESVFARQYQQGMQKSDYWQATLEDSLQLIAKLPGIAAYIYNCKYKSGCYISPDFNLDWSANFARMIGVDSPEFMDVARLYFLLHADHESGNVSAHATHLVGSSLSDVYYSCAAGINGLAGPLHGLANQESLRWLLSILERFAGLPSREQITQFAWDTLNAGQVIPGYGHAVLRLPDPRFTAQFEFGMNFLPDDELFQLVQLVNEVIPQVLREQGKVKNPWPNVDAVSGALLYHYGMREQDFYTVLFGVSRILGVTANLIWARALGQPIERPKSLTTKMLEDLAAAK